MKIWIDFDNTPHVNVLLPLIRSLQEEHEIIMTARDVFETVPLLHENNIYPVVIGTHKGKNRIKKVIGLSQRIATLFFNVPTFDISFSLGGNTTATVSKLRGKRSIVFSDNDISFKAPAYKFSNYFIFPDYFDTTVIEKRYNISKEKIFKFNGFKEDIYIADFKPDPNFLDKLPFKDFITIRPENLKASYVPANSKTIVIELFKRFKKHNILFLPRYPEEKNYAVGFNNIFIPDKPLSGLDVCYYTKAMLTGAGTFAREAAILGKPSVSFFPGKTFLSVDEYMISKNWIFRSRNVDAIYDYVMKSIDVKADLERSVKAKKEVLDIFKRILTKP
jgi:predicted glycosyltransferase